MWKLLLLNCLIASAITQSHAKDEDKASSSIYDTESHEHNADSDSGISESGVSDSVPSGRVAKARLTTRPPVKPKAGVRSSKFPLQFATRVTKGSSEEYDDATAQTVGKKIYKDTGYRKKKFEDILLKEKRKESTKNPNKKKKTTPVTVRTKKPRHRNPFENVSDLNFPTGLFTEAPLVATALIGSGEQQIDKSKAGQIIADLKAMYKEKLASSNEGSDRDESSINQRSDNPIFRPSNETGAFDRYDDDDDEDDDKQHDKDDEKHEQEYSKESHKKAGTGTTSEEYTEEDDTESRLTTLTQAEKEERAYRVLSKLRNETNIHVDTAERANHKKIIMDTLRRQGLSNSDEEILDVVSHYDSVTEKLFARTRPFNITYGCTTKKGILHSIEQAYARALKQTKKNRTRDSGTAESKEYSRMTLDKKPKGRSEASRERRKQEKKEKRKRQREEREKNKTSSKEKDKEGSKPEEQKKMIRERPSIPKREDRYERRRDSRERYRGRYESRDRYRDRGPPGRYSRERYRGGRYDSRPRYGDRQRFDSRERYRERDRPRSRERYRPRVDSRERYRDRPRRDSRGEDRDPRRGGERVTRREWGRGERETRRAWEGRENRGGAENRYTRRRSRERQSRKKWYSEEGPEAKRVYAKPTERRPGNRGDTQDRHVRNAGRARMSNYREKAAPTKDSFSRDYSQFATNDEQNSVFKNFMKSKKLRDMEAMGEDIVTIP